LRDKKKKIAKTDDEDILRSIGKTVLQDILADFIRIGKRLDSEKSHITTIRSNFESRLASKNGEEQEKTNKAINWMTTFGVCVLPMNLVAGFFGMNVCFFSLSHISLPSSSLFLLLLFIPSFTLYQVPVPMQGSILDSFLQDQSTESDRFFRCYS
jgi:Mg2+ and Co2+ transporter CorA